MPRSEISLPVVPTGVPRSTGTRSKTTARSAAGQPPPYDAANYAQVRIFPKTDSVQSYEMAFRQPTQHTMSARSARSKGRSVQQSDTGAVGCCGAKKKPKKKSGGCCDWGDPKSRVTTQKLKPPGSSGTRGPMRHGTRSEMTPQRDDPRFAEQRFTEQRPVRGRPPLTGTRVEWKIPPLEENQVPVAASIVETKLITCEGNIIPWVLPIDGGGHKIYVPSEMERRLTHLPNILEVVRCVPLNESELSAEELQSLAAWEQYRADA